MDKNLTYRILVTFVLFIVFDLIWFSVSLNTIYDPTFKNIQKEIPLYSSRIIGGIYAWILLGFGLNYFVTPISKTPKEAFMNGFLYGLIVYGVYNGTNYVTFNKWNKNIFLFDNLYGSFISGIISLIVFNLFA